MKTLRMIGMALFAVLMCVNFASCSNEEVTPDDPNQEKYITVGLDCVGEYLDIKDSPLSRAAGDDKYIIQVYSVDESGKQTPYANGRFAKSLDEVIVKLLHGGKYKFKVAIVVEGVNGSYGESIGTDFIYSDADTYFYDYNPTKEVFYGELDNYTAIEGDDVEISTKRVSYAAKFIAEGLDEGTIEIIVSNMKITNKKRYSVSLTPEFPESDKIYSFFNTYDAWKGIYNRTGEDPETGSPIYEYLNYSSVKTLNINWNKTEDDIIPLGNYDVTFKRNVRTTIRIKVENPSYSNGITITREDVAISDDENEYNIEGGKITEIPVNSES